MVSSRHASLERSMHVAASFRMETWQATLQLRLLVPRPPQRLQLPRGPLGQWEAVQDCTRRRTQPAAVDRSPTAAPPHCRRSLGIATASGRWRRSFQQTASALSAQPTRQRRPPQLAQPPPPLIVRALVPAAWPGDPLAPPPPAHSQHVPTRPPLTTRTSSCMAWRQSRPPSPEGGLFLSQPAALPSPRWLACPSWGRGVAA